MLPSEVTMDINRLTEKAQEAVLTAQQFAEQAGHPQIEPEHLVLTLVEQHEGVVPALLQKLDVEPAALAAATRAALERLPSATGCAAPAISVRLRGVLTAATGEAGRLSDEHVGTEHLFLALAAETGTAPAARLLSEHGLARDRPAGSCTPSARRPWTSTASTSRRTPRSSAVSSRSWSRAPARSRCSG